MHVRPITPAIVLALLGGAALAKLPPLGDEAKAKAAEAAAKTAHGNKVADFQLCNAMNKVAARHAVEAKKAGKEPRPTDTPACSDPGAFVYTPPGAAPAAPAATPAAAPAASAPAAPKKT